MFRSHRLIFTSLVLAIFFLSCYPTLVHAQAQPDNFPIGLYIVYTVDSQLPPGEEDIYTIRYDFREWVDQDTLCVEYEKDAATYNECLYEIYLDGPPHPPIWLDVSLLQSQSVFVFSGYTYYSTITEEIWVPNLGDQECYRMEYSLLDNGGENWSIIWYQCETGILVDYSHNSFYENYSLRQGYSEFITGSNLDEFNPPTFTVPTSTTTTQSGTTTTPTSSSTSTTTSSSRTYTRLIPSTTGLSGLPLSSTELIMIFGIFVEIIVIALIFNKRK